MNSPKIIAEMPEDAPKWLAVPGFQVEIPTEYDPATLDRFLVTVEVSVRNGRPDYRTKEIYQTLDGQKVATGRYVRTAPRWLYSGEVLMGTQEIADFQPYQLSLITEAAS